jgi:hypothetical protein
LRLHIVAARLELGGASADLIFQRIGEDPVTFLALAQIFFGFLAMGDVTGGTSDDFDVAATVENRAENIFVIAAGAGGAGIRRFVGQSLLGIENLLNLFLQALGEVGRTTP